ncbi:MAG: hypothetical protein KJ645_11810 [Planctomycetes bacterium]|nr:hypothetical protein [Planctomycetota bacterium]
METIKDILQLRKTVRRLENEAADLAIFAPSAKEAEAFDRMAMELHDVDMALYNAIFIKNNSKIEALIKGIQKTTDEANQVRTQLEELTNIFQKARDVVKKANNYAGKAKETLDKVREVLKKLKQPV